MTVRKSNGTRIVVRVSAAAALLLATACGGSDDDGVVEVTGSTGMCTESGTVWSGDAPDGGAVPGRVLERTVTCPTVTMSDDRLSGSYTNDFRCEFALQGDQTIGECTQNSAIANGDGTWEETDGSFTITLAPGEPTAIVEEGIRSGTGDYVGLRFVYRTGGGSSYPWPITGTIEPVD